jgi:hypothetical protein
MTQRGRWRASIKRPLACLGWAWEQVIGSERNASDDGGSTGRALPSYISGRAGWLAIGQISGRAERGKADCMEAEKKKRSGRRTMQRGSLASGRRWLDGNGSGNLPRRRGWAGNMPMQETSEASAQPHSDRPLTARQRRQTSTSGGDGQRGGCNLAAVCHHAILP